MTKSLYVRGSPEKMIRITFRTANERPIEITSMATVPVWRRRSGRHSATSFTAPKPAVSDGGRHCASNGQPGPEPKRERRTQSPHPS